MKPNYQYDKRQRELAKAKKKAEKAKKKIGPSEPEADPGVAPVQPTEPA